MKEKIGVLLFFVIFAFSGYCLLFTSIYATRVTVFSIIGILISFGLILSDRLTYVKLLGLGEIQAATKQANEEVKRIEELRKEFESEKIMIDALMQDAETLRDEINDLGEFASSVDDKIDNFIIHWNQLVERWNSYQRNKKYYDFLDRHP